MRPLSITIDTLVHAKVMHWVRQAGKFEVSGFGQVIQIGNRLHVVDAFLLEQKNTSFDTVIDPQIMGRAIFDRRESPDSFRWWWHSHGYGNTFFSKTDFDQIEAFSKNGWIAATVFNHFGNTHSGFATNEPFPIYVDNLEFQPIYFPNATLSKHWEQDYLEKVKNFEPAPRAIKDKRRGRKGRFEKIREVAQIRSLVAAMDDEQEVIYDAGL